MNNRIDYIIYNLEIEPWNEEVYDIFIKENQIAKPAFNTNISVKWYDHEKALKNFSKQFPDLLFILEGVGETTGDVWIKYFKDGKMQFCPGTIVFDDYDKDKLK